MGYGLIGSSYPPLQSIGIVSTVSVLTLMVASVVVLPAMIAKDRVNVVALIPALNEAATIAQAVVEIRPHVSAVVVSDGSTDATTDLARAAGATVLVHDETQGKGQAVRTGLAHVLQSSDVSTS